MGKLERKEKVITKQKGNRVEREERKEVKMVGAKHIINCQITDW